MLHWNSILFLPFSCLFSPLFLKSTYQTPAVWQRLIFAVAIYFIAIGYVTFTIHFPDSALQTEYRGTAIFDINNFAVTKKHHGTYGSYKGTIKAFYIDGQRIAKNLPTTISLSNRYNFPPADSNYQIQGILKEIGHHVYVLTPDKATPWKPLPGTWSLAGWRQKMKQKVSQYIHHHIPDQRSANFLSGIATGDFEDRLISKELGRFGLQHIMAISGFHFTIVAAILSLFLRLIIPKRFAVMVLIGLVTGYFLFLGCGPSILRAWFACLIALFSFLTERKSLAVNTLGLALIVVLVVDPTLSGNLGFQFSFASTAAILLLYQPCDELIQKIFKIKNLSVTSKMGPLTQHAYCLLCLCREASALGIAVNLVALPLTLFYFHKFPLLGFIYNLFFPFMVSAAMLLLIFGMITTLILPPLSGLLHVINSSFTRFMLNYAYNLPTNFDFLWRTSGIPVELIALLFCLLFALGVYYREHCKERVFDDFMV